jgi:glycerol-3-phosphate cytidylyltransferase
MIKVGFTCGAFDLLHAGHVVMLKEAKEKNQPIQSIYERYLQLKAIKYVDEILPYDTEESLMDLLESTNIDVRFVGEEYQTKTFTGKGLHPIFYTSRKHTFSTTSLRNRISTKH